MLKDYHFSIQLPLRHWKTEELTGSISAPMCRSREVVDKLYSILCRLEKKVINYIPRSQIRTHVFRAKFAFVLNPFSKDFLHFFHAIFHNEDQVLVKEIVNKDEM